MKIDKKQILFLNKAKELIKRCGKNKFQKKSNSLFYLSTYTKSFGHLIVNRLLNNTNISEYLDIVLKELFSTCSKKYKSIISKKKFLFKKVIISWASSSDFKKDGSYTDRLLNINSKNEKDTLWYLIYLDKKLPSKIDLNISLFQIVNRGFNFAHILKLFFNNISYLFKDSNYFLSSISTHNDIAINVADDFKKFLTKDLKKIIINYEAQPFQNEIIRKTKKFNKNIIIIGNVHVSLMAIPTHFIFKDFSPDKIIVNGLDIKFFFVNYLGWPLKRILLKKSLRFFHKKKDMGNFIFLPNNINSIRLIKNSFDFLINCKFYDFYNFKVRIHPGQLNSKIHLKLSTILEKKISYIKKILISKKIKTFQFLLVLLDQ